MLNAVLCSKYTEKRTETLLGSVAHFQGKKIQHQNEKDPLARDYFSKVHRILVNVTNDPEYKLEELIDTKSLTSPRHEEANKMRTERHQKHIKTLQSICFNIEQFLLGHTENVKDIKIVCQELTTLANRLDMYDFERINRIMEIPKIHAAVRQLCTEYVDQKMIKKHSCTFVQQNLAMVEKRQALPHSSSPEVYMDFQSKTFDLRIQLTDLVRNIFDSNERLLRQCCSHPNNMKLEDYIIEQILPVAFDRYDEMHSSDHWPKSLQIPRFNGNTWTLIAPIASTKDESSKESIPDSGQQHCKSEITSDTGVLLNQNQSPLIDTECSFEDLYLQEFTLNIAIPKAAEEIDKIKSNAEKRIKSIEKEIEELEASLKGIQEQRASAEKLKESAERREKIKTIDSQNRDTKIKIKQHEEAKKQIETSVSPLVIEKTHRKLLENMLLEEARRTSNAMTSSYSSTEVSQISNSDSKHPSLHSRTTNDTEVSRSEDFARSRAYSESSKSSVHGSNQRLSDSEAIFIETSKSQSSTGSLVSSASFKHYESNGDKSSATVLVPVSEGMPLGGPNI